VALRRAGVQALNRCIEVVALAEKRIGEELVKGQEAGKLLPPGRPRGKNNGELLTHPIPAHDLRIRHPVLRPPGVCSSLCRSSWGHRIHLPFASVV
jgi:hypothetical protein